MVDLARRIAAEKEYVTIAMDNLKETMSRRKKSTVELAAAATFLHNIYNGIENILKQILKAKNIDIPETKSWHKDLLDRSAQLGIIPGELADQLYEYLTFRHFFIHSYGFMLEETQLEVLAENISDIWARFTTAVDKHRLSLGNSS